MTLLSDLNSSQTGAKWRISSFFLIEPYFEIWLPSPLYVAEQRPALFRGKRKADLENFLRTIWNDSVKSPVCVSLCLLSQTRAYLGNIVCVRIAGSTSVTVFKIKRPTVVIYVWRLRSLHSLLKSTSTWYCEAETKNRALEKMRNGRQPRWSNGCCVVLHCGLHKDSTSPKLGR